MRNTLVMGTSTVLLGCPPMPAVLESHGPLDFCDCEDILGYRFHRLETCRVEEMFLGRTQGKRHCCSVCTVNKGVCADVNSSWFWSNIVA